MLVEVVHKNFDTFAASAIDFRRTSVVVHTIKTNAAKPIKKKLQQNLLSLRQYLKQKVKKLLAIGAISEADLVARLKRIVRLY